MKKLESPDKEPPDLAKEAEDAFIKTMKEINDTSQTDQASGGGNEENEFIKMMQEINTDNQPGEENNEEENFADLMKNINQ